MGGTTGAAVVGGLVGLTAGPLGFGGSDLGVGVETGCSETGESGAGFVISFPTTSNFESIVVGIENDEVGLDSGAGFICAGVASDLDAGGFAAVV